MRYQISFSALCLVMAIAVNQCSAIGSASLLCYLGGVSAQVLNGCIYLKGGDRGDLVLLSAAAILTTVGSIFSYLWNGSFMAGAMVGLAIALVPTLAGGRDVQSE